MHYTIHNINVVAVIVAAVASFLIGGLWYSPVLFANSWIKALGKTKEEIMNGGRQVMMRGMITSIVQALVVAVAIAHFYNLTPAWPTLGMAVETALVCWFAFIFMIALVQRTYERSNVTLFYITIGYRFFEFLAIGLIVYFIH